MRDRPGAVYFDLYGTLLDLGPLDDACEALVPGRGAAFARTWRMEQLRLTWLRTIMGAWADFAAVTEAALGAAAATFGVDATVAAATLGEAFRRLPARQEAPRALSELRAAGCRLGVLSNGSREMLAGSLDETGLASLVDDVLSVDAVRRYKPDPAVYDLAVRASGLRPAEIGFVTANDWDAAGGAAFGLRVVWLRPPGAVSLPEVGAPPARVASWDDLVASLASPPG